MSTTPELINYLNKEIEICLNNAITFRMKSAFAVWVGPFALLGTLIISIDGGLEFDSSVYNVIAMALLILCYLALGYNCGKVEASYYKRADELREMLVNVAKYGTYEIDMNKLKQTNLRKIVARRYSYVFGVFTLVFGLTVFLIFELLPKQPTI